MHQSCIVSVGSARIHVSFDDRGDPFFSVSSEESSSLDNLVVVFNAISREVKVSIDLEDPCFQFVAFAVVKVWFVGILDHASSLGRLRCVHNNVAHREGVQSVKSMNLKWK